MRTGAIFARGSCRALKWMALLGVVFTLGAGQVVAQQDVTLTELKATYNQATVTVTAVRAVRTSADTFSAAAFTINGVAATAETVSDDANGSTSFTVTFASNLTGTPTLVYTPPAAGQARIIAATGSGGPVARFDVTVYSVNADLPLIANKTIKAGDTADITLPEAVGGTTITYSLTGLPTGGSLAFTAATRKIGGVPAAADVGRHQLTYEADNDGGSNATTQFYLTVEAADPTGPPTGKAGQIHLMELTGTGVEMKTIGSSERIHVTEGASAVLNVTVVWKHSELKAMYDAGDTADRTIEVEIKGDDASEQTQHTLPDWVSWIDHEGDAHWPNTGACLGSREPGRLCGVVTVKVPKNPTDYVGSDRHTKMEKGTLTVYMPHDNHEAENDAFYIEAVHSDKVDLAATATYKKTTPVVVIEDDDEQMVTITRKTPTKPTPIYESDGSAVFTITADPKREDLPLGVRLAMVDLKGVTVSSQKISLSTAALTLNSARDGVSNSSDVTVHLPASDGDRVDDDYEMHASVNLYSLGSGAYNQIYTAKEPLTVIDVHKLPTLTVSPATGSVMEGGKTTLTLTLNRNPSDTIAYDPEKRQYTSEEVSVTLSSTADDADYAISPNPITVSKHNAKAPWMQEVMVEVEAMTDEDVGAEMLVLDAEVMGSVAANGANTDDDSYMGVSMLTIEDKTMKQVEPKPAAEAQAAVDKARDAAAGAEGLNPGESFMVMTSDLFTVATGYTAGYGVASSDPSVSASASGDSVTITANSVGSAEITVTATATGMSSATTSQTVSNVAQVMFDVVVTEMNLTVMLSAPEGHDMNLAEGSTVRLMAKTNRPVGADTIVELVYMGGTASAADYEADPIAIKMGEMEGSTLLMAVADNMAEDMETLMIEGRIGGLKSNGLTFNLWDAAVPALPVIAQLLLGAFLAVGGYRRYRRR